MPDAPSPSTVRKLLDIMIDRGLLGREYEGPRHVYFPSAKLEDASRSALRQLIATFFDGSPWALAAVGLLLLPILTFALPAWTVGRFATPPCVSVPITNLETSPRDVASATTSTPVGANVPSQRSTAARALMTWPVALGAPADGRDGSRRLPRRPRHTRDADRAGR